jgi:protein MPE1
MASSVFYKFKSQKDESRVTFDGTGISVFDLKKEIILANNLGKANDFDLFVSDSSSGQGEWYRAYVSFFSLKRRNFMAEFKDDSQIIPRSSSVIVRRLPSSRPGKGKAAMYIAGVVPDTSPRTSGPIASVSSNSTWHKGAISKRFNTKEEPLSISKPLIVRNRLRHRDGF